MSTTTVSIKDLKSWRKMEMAEQTEIDANDIVESLLVQMSQQARTIAILDATVTALKLKLSRYEGAEAE